VRLYENNHNRKKYYDIGRRACLKSQLTSLSVKNTLILQADAILVVFFNQNLVRVNYGYECSTRFQFYISYKSYCISYHLKRTSLELVLKYYFLYLTAIYFCQLNQGTLPEVEGSVLLTSSLR